MIIVTVKQCAPNRFPVRVIDVRENITDAPTYMVEETDPEGYWEYTEEGNSVFETKSLEKAMKYFKERVKELSETPNWEAQEEYDDEHGTINGYAPWQFNEEN